MVIVLDINTHSAKKLKKAFPIYVILCILTIALIIYFMPTTSTIIEIAFINITVNTIFIAVMIIYISYKSKPKLSRIYNMYIFEIVIMCVNGIAT